MFALSHSRISDAPRRQPSNPVRGRVQRHPALWSSGRISAPSRLEEAYGCWPPSWGPVRPCGTKRRFGLFGGTGLRQQARPWRSGPGRLTGPSCGWLPSPGLRCGHGRRPSPHRVGIRAAEGSLGGNGGRGGARCPLQPGRTPPSGEAVRCSVLDRGVWRRMRLRRLPGARRRGPG